MDETLTAITTRSVAMSDGRGATARVAAGTEVTVSRIGNDGFAVIRPRWSLLSQRVQLATTVRVP